MINEIEEKKTRAKLLFDLLKSRHYRHILSEDWTDYEKNQHEHWRNSKDNEQYFSEKSLVGFISNLENFRNADERFFSTVDERFTSLKIIGITFTDVLMAFRHHGIKPGHTEYTAFALGFQCLALIEGIVEGGN